MRYDDRQWAGGFPGPLRRPGAEGPKKTTIPVKVRREQPQDGMPPTDSEPDTGPSQGRGPAEQAVSRDGWGEAGGQEGLSSRGDAAGAAQAEAARRGRPSAAPDSHGERSRADEATGEGGSATAATTEATREASEVEEWRERALRLQAEMDNFRRRQQRLAQDESREERDRLLKGFLVVIDNLERALAAPAGDNDQIRQGVGLTYRAAMQFLQQEGVAQIRAENQLFDPNWHEAVATLPSRDAAAGPNTVVQVMQQGYHVGERLLRPAKVVVAV